VHHLAVLRDALSECDQFDMGTGEVYEALEHWRPEYSPGQLHALLTKISSDLNLD